MSGQGANSNIQYADDTLVFLDGGKNQLGNLISLIHCFELVSGMKVNWPKSCLVGLNSSSQDHLGYLKALSCPIRAFPLEYLEVPLGGIPRKRDFWLPTLHKVKRKVSHLENQISLLWQTNPPHQINPIESSDLFSIHFQNTERNCT